MARWKVKSATGGSIAGGFEYESGKAHGDYAWQVYQDEKPFLEQAKADRENTRKRDVGYKKFATIPDIVALEIKEKYGVDVHDPVQSSDSNVMKRFRKIVQQDYPYLLSY